MKQPTRIAIAALLHSAGKALSALAFEFGGVEAAGEPATTTEPSTPAEPPAKTRKPREPKAEKPVEPAAPAEEASQPEETTEVPSGVMTFELKSLIEPFVKGGQGGEVKKLIAKYNPDSATPSIKTMPAKNHAAFEKDIQALGY